MRKIRVAHIITRLCRGGAQENTFHTVRLASRDRFEAELFAGPPESAEGSLEGTVRAAEIEIHRVEALRRSVSPVRDTAALMRLAMRLRNGRYDIVHTHTSKAGFIGRLAARMARVPIVVHTPHGNIFHGYFPAGTTRVFVGLERLAARWTDRIIELTQQGIEESLAEGIGKREQYVRIFSGIDLTPFEAARQRRELTRASLGIVRGDFLIGGIGRLEPVKGFRYFIEAARLIAVGGPQFRFVLAGQGSLDAALRADTSVLGNRFRFLGLRDDVPDLMAALDVLVVPSVNEGMGRVLLEAGAAGVPVIASRVGGIPEIVEDSITGVLVSPKSPEAIAQVAVAMARDPDRMRRMSEAAWKKVVPEFGVERMLERIEALYEELIREKALDT